MRTPEFYSTVLLTPSYNWTFYTPNYCSSRLYAKA